MMETWEKVKQLRDDLVQDLRAGLEFHPEPHRDIQAFMRKYLNKAAYDNRVEVLDEILGNLMECANGEDYPCPYAEDVRYTNEDITAVEMLLDGYLSAMQNGFCEAVPGGALREIESMDADGGTWMFDTWRRETLHELFDCAEKLAMEQHGNMDAGRDMETSGMDGQSM